MPEPTEQPKRTRRDRRADQVYKPCAREGCRGRAKPPNGYCSFVCKVISSELAKAQRVCQALGADTSLVAELWAEVVALSDGWSRYQALDRRIRREAAAVGFTDEQWRQLADYQASPAR